MPTVYSMHHIWQLGEGHTKDVIMWREDRKKLTSVNGVSQSSDNILKKVNSRGLPKLGFGSGYGHK